MTVPTTVGRGGPYTGDGATSAYNVGFHFQADADLDVTVTSTADVETTLTLNTHYTVTGAGDQSGGTITLISSYANLTTGYILVIRLKPALNNSTSFVNGGKVSNAQIQTFVDRLSQRDIRQQDELDRCLKLPTQETGTSAKTVIGDATARASKYLGFDSSGNPTLTSSVSSGSLNVSAYGETLLDDLSADAAQTTLGISTFVKTILDDTTGPAVQTTIGISAAAQTVLDDASVAAMRTTLGLDGASGAIAALDLANAITPQLFQARLSLTSATPVTTGDVNSGTIYLVPYKGSKIGLWNGTRWKLHDLSAEISLALTATQDKNYDVWVYDNAGTLTLETTEWTNDTTRATALAFQDGVYCKTGVLTRRYVGTFRAHAANTTTDSSAKRFVWNYYNRAPRLMEKTINTATWDYTTATWRQMEASASNQVAWVLGIAVEELLHFQLQARSSNVSTGTDRRVGVGLNSTSAPNMVANVFGEGTTSVYAHTLNQWQDQSLGYTFAAMLEYSEAAGTTTWYGNDTVSTFDTTRLRVMGHF